MVPLEIVTLVLRKFRSSQRDAGFRKKPEYAHIKEKNKEIYLSSTYYKFCWAYKHFLSFLEMMKKGGNSHFTCLLPYQLGTESQIKNIDEMQAEYDEGVDELTWKMEYECHWIGNDDDQAYFKYEKLDPTRKLTKAFYPQEVLNIFDKDGKYKKFMEKKQNEIRILFMDVARKASEGIDNDATSIGLMCCHPIEDNRLNTNYYIREIPFMETITGTNTVIQSLRLRELYEWFEADYIVCDFQSIGSAIADNLSLPLTNPETGIEYPPLNTINHEEMRMGTVLYPSAPKVVYGVMAGAKFNSDIAFDLRDTMSKHRLRILVDDMEARKHLTSIKGYDELDAETKGKLLQPFAQLTAFVNEAVSLETSYTDIGIVRLKEKSGQRKDRVVSVMYANMYASKLEKELFTKQGDWDEEDDCLDVIMV